VTYFTLPTRVSSIKTRPSRSNTMMSSDKRRPR
jgi:hypothetical protein